LVNVRTAFVGKTSKPDLQKAAKVRSRAKPADVARVWIDGKPAKTAIYDRDALRHGHTIQGPAIIGEYSSTTLVPPDFHCMVDAYLNLVLSKRGRRP
jgi:N-methylhydantoinase A